MDLRLSEIHGKKNEPMHIKRILIEKGAEAYNQTRNILKSLDNITVEEIDEDEQPPQSSLDPDKNTLRLLSFKGELFKPCPGTKSYICCGYQILHGGANCPLDCSYCILQAYFNQPSLRVFVNLEDELHNIIERIDNQPDKIFRVGTGEFMDSLALDHIACWSDILCKTFSRRKNCILELKTKTTNIEKNISAPVRDRIIISWSLNSPYIASKEEKGAPSIQKRLEAAKRCQEEGFITGFHFDPLISHSGWKEGYKKTIDYMDKYIDPKKIIWISMGCMRYIPSLKKIIRKRHPDSEILNGEFVRGLDGKMRYFKPLRIEIYSFMREIIEDWAGMNPGLYLCMESDEIWRKGMGWSPKDSEGLSKYLDNRVRLFFG